jgi:hypothetical protein
MTTPEGKVFADDEKHPYCSYINDGNCQYFEKENWFIGRIRDLFNRITDPDCQTMEG